MPMFGNVSYDPESLLMVLSDCYGETAWSSAPGTELPDSDQTGLTQTAAEQTIAPGKT